MGLPYFDLILEHKGDPAARAFDRYVHWGWWDGPGDAAALPEAMARLDREVIAAAAVADGHAVLDAGCGFGGTLEALGAARAGLRRVGVNIDLRQLKEARLRRKAPPAFLNADACRLPLADGAFDRVLAVECIFHFPSRQAFLKEAARVLKPGGRLALSDFVPRWIGGGGPLGRGLERIVSEGYGTLGGGWSDGSYEEMAAKAGLKVVLDRDVTRHTLRTYPLLLELLEPYGDEAKALRRGTRVLQGLSRLRLLHYRITAFEKA